jgi:hypothetical protein
MIQTVTAGEQISAIRQSWRDGEPAGRSTRKAPADADVVPDTRCRFGDPAWEGSAEEIAWWVRAARLEQEQSARLRR